MPWDVPRSVIRNHLALNMTCTQVVETSVTITNSSFHNYTHLDDQARQTFRDLGAA